VTKSPSNRRRANVRKDHEPNGSEPKTCLILAKEIGLIGSAIKAPPDLSTSRKQFNSFGRRWKSGLDRSRPQCRDGFASASAAHANASNL